MHVPATPTHRRHVSTDVSTYICYSHPSYIYIYMLARLGLELQVEAREGCVPRAAARQVVEVDQESEVPAPVVVQQGSGV